ncbi:HEPN/Toprim-associated domain-containing protein [Companilactobacillus mishanensis]|uniref:HEPN/Toprim N-terminal domain-containing protein n=1 Tax=Companilactobacillus mishanensis TaxID=2486008 RepID=A0A5P0ZJ41_9LACO|nr:HEPN/Toprim-associated domain-containing protein [Companilactobacillus mishanensis]MQS53136.1 hypothetical protein [Companilactobacillus mishanensis]
MGEYSVLTIGKFELEYAKNAIPDNVFELFLFSDKKNVYKNNSKIKGEFVKSGYDIKSRLDLLGYSEKNLLKKYTKFQNSLPSYLKFEMTFIKFKSVVLSINLAEKPHITNSDDEFFYHLDSDIQRYIFHNLEIHDSNTTMNMMEALNYLDPLLVLRILLEDYDNCNNELRLDYYDVMEAGWITEDNLKFEINKNDKIFIVTEGHSDTEIIESSINELAPKISDFFEFIDMSANYGYTGTSMIIKLYNALCKLDIQKQILIVVDNDLTGNQCIDKLKVCSQLPNIKYMTLPYLNSAEHFPVLRKHIKAEENINKYAVTIETFLDFKKLDPYISVGKSGYGKIVPKTEIKKIFFKRNNKNYDYHKLQFLVNSIVDFWIQNR